MNEKYKFIEKVLNKLDKVDKESLRDCIGALVAEKDEVFSLLEVMPDGVVVVSTDKIVLFSNSAARDMLMKSRWVQIETLKDLFADSGLLHLVTTAIEQSTRFVNRQIDMLTPLHKVLLVSVIPVFNGKHEHAVAERFVIVLKKEADEITLEAVRKCANMEALTKLAAGIAHEIGNPLNTIKIYLQLISKELQKLGNIKVKEWVDIITAETKRLDVIIKEFLTATRGRLNIYCKSDINQCVDDAVNFLLPEINDKKIRVTKKQMKEIPPFYMDRDKIYQALINVLKNSIEAMPSGGALNITTVLKENLVSLVISDNGVGIEDEHIPYLFDAYYTTKPEGSGLGLMNVYNIIRAHRGRVDIESKVGKGTKVTIALPLLRDKLQLPHQTGSNEAIDR